MISLTELDALSRWLDGPAPEEGQCAHCGVQPISYDTDEPTDLCEPCAAEFFAKAHDSLAPLLRAVRAARAYYEATEALIEAPPPVLIDDVPAHHEAQDRQADAALMLWAALAEVGE